MEVILILMCSFSVSRSVMEVWISVRVAEEDSVVEVMLLKVEVNILALRLKLFARFCSIMLQRLLMRKSFLFCCSESCDVLSTCWLQCRIDCAVYTLGGGGLVLRARFFFVNLYWFFFFYFVPFVWIFGWWMVVILLCSSCGF